MTRRVGDVMNTQPVSVEADVPFKELARTMAERLISALPVVDDECRVVGVVSEADLIVRDETFGRRPHVLEGRAVRTARRKTHALTAGDLMTSPAVTVRPGATLAEAAGLMRKHRVKRLPVCDGDGRLVGVLSRLDLVREFVRDDAEIAEEVAHVLRHELFIPPSDVLSQVRGGVVTLAGRLDLRSQVSMVVDRVRRIDGTVEVLNRLSWVDDDEAMELGPIPRIGL
jgi:CBS domain-containing protein